MRVSRSLRKDTKIKFELFKKNSGDSLAEAVKKSVRRYFRELENQPTTDFYAMVLKQVERPLLEETMAYTEHNQSAASKILGLNRGTLRTKLKQHKLLD